MSEVTITVSGPVGCAKSALLGEIEIMLKAMGVPVRYADEAAARAEKNMTHADWTGSIEMYKPSVVLVERIERASSSNGPAQKIEGGAVQSDADRAFYGFWYGHMKNEVMTGVLADVWHSTARYIWDSALKSSPQAPKHQGGGDV